ncbi:glycogen synthase [Xiamenia xianingshaonis]|uniref:glycogen synthase n=1 Tax=Xiamenia xianingshaonis TaxID=2682776 RepID=UPI0021BDC558|nr:glycogen synthase [Xiamenia xianingshaonis]
MTESKTPSKRTTTKKGVASAEKPSATATTAAAAATPASVEKEPATVSNAAKATSAPAEQKASAEKAPVAKAAEAEKAAAPAKEPAAEEVAAAKAPAKRATAKKTTKAPAKKTAAKKTTAAKTAASKTVAAAEAAEEASAPKKAAAKPAARKTTTRSTTTRKTAAKKAAPTAKAAEETKPAETKAAPAVEAAPAAQAAEEAKAPEASAEPAPVVAAAPEFADLPPVLIVAAECAPLAKTGGLADVVGALPKYLAKLGVDARVIMPLHRDIKARFRYETTHLFDYNASGVWPSRFVGIEKLEHEGVTYYFVDNEYYFGGDIYSGGNFEGQQYGFFVQAVCDALPNLDFNPGIVHCNDWHTALIPFKIKARAKREGSWPPATVLTIHNLAFQGTFGDDLESKLIGDDERAFAWDLGCWNMLKAGIDVSDRVNTVSTTYANEICTPAFGEGLQNDLAHVRDEGRLWGILNGIDTDVWNPQTDPCLPARFSADDMAGKRECKRELLAELGLDDDVDAPLIAMVGRLTPQKGLELVPGIVDSLVPMGAKFVILGSGYPELEWQMRELEGRYKGRVCSYIGYNGDLSHRIYAASDFFLMPSAFEPCGISQMIAMRYGSLPIVHETGGLVDTVEPYNQFTGEGCGFSFARFDFWDAVEACKRALEIYGDTAIMRRLTSNAMERDFGFDRCARMYAEMYRSMM